MSPDIFLLCAAEPARTISPQPASTAAAATPPKTDTQRGDDLLAEYFRLKTEEIESRSMAEIQTAADWNAHKDDYRQQLQEMLGLSPWPQKTPLNPVITDRIEHDDFVVEKLHFESLPGLHVTADFYRPKVIEQPLPAILYVCGHSTQKKGNVSYGNKTGYQHHGIWFARNGYCCLIIDTIQLGEIQGIHHGTHHEGMWWWHSRGYTPAGVEAWNGIRALDYLQSRSEVDPEKIGMTGRSGGGAYTWYTAALDERVKVAVPVAGITNLRNHVVDGVVKGHCDCMYWVNLHGWDFDHLAALIAPRPLLITNTDKDPIFPLEGVIDVYNKARRIYKLLGAENHIGLCIAEGGHADVQQLQNDAFLWFNRFLKNDKSQIAMITEKLFPPADLTAFSSLPKDERVTSVQEWFTPRRSLLKTANSRDVFLKAVQPAIERLRDPAGSSSSARTKADVPPLDTKLVGTFKNDAGGLRLRIYEFNSDAPYRLPFYVLDHGRDEQQVTLDVLDETGWQAWEPRLQASFPQWQAAKPMGEPEELPEFNGTLVLFAPRGVGPTEWTADEKARLHIRRRFPLIGTTLERTQVEDVRRAISAICHATSTAQDQLEVQAGRSAADWALHAVLLSGGVRKLQLDQISPDYRTGPQFLGLQQLASLQDLVVATAAECQSVILKTDNQEELKAWLQLQAEARKLDIANIEVVGS